MKLPRMRRRMWVCRNFYSDAGEYFSWLVRTLGQRLWETTRIEERVRLAEEVLFRKMDLRTGTIKQGYHLGMQRFGTGQLRQIYFDKEDSRL